MPLLKLALRKTIADIIEPKFHNSSDCLMSQFDHQATIDLLIKISVLQETEYLRENVETDWNLISNKLRATRVALHKVLENIVFMCETDKRFFDIFVEYLGNKNEILKVLKLDYCMAKYVADNQLLNLDNVELNPHDIASDDVDCNNVIELERKKSFEHVVDKISSLPNAEAMLGCVLDIYKNGNIFDSRIAFKVLHSLDVPKEIKESENFRLNQNLTEFGMSTFTCS